MLGIGSRRISLIMNSLYLNLRNLRFSTSFYKKEILTLIVYRSRLVNLNKSKGSEIEYTGYRFPMYKFNYGPPYLFMVFTHFVRSTPFVVFQDA